MIVKDGAFFSTNRMNTAVAHTEEGREEESSSSSSSSFDPETAEGSSVGSAVRQSILPATAPIARVVTQTHTETFASESDDGGTELTCARIRWPDTANHSSGLFVGLFLGNARIRGFGNCVGTKTHTQQPPSGSASQTHTHYHPHWRNNQGRSTSRLTVRSPIVGTCTERLSHKRYSEERTEQRVRVKGGAAAP